MHVLSSLSSPACPLQLAHSSTAPYRSAALVGCPTRTLAASLALTRADHLIPDTRSFRVGLRRGVLGRVKLDHGLRFLVGQPQDEEDTHRALEDEKDTDEKDTHRAATRMRD